MHGVGPLADLEFFLDGGDFGNPSERALRGSGLTENEIWALVSRPVGGGGALGAYAPPQVSKM